MKITRSGDAPRGAGPEDRSMATQQNRRRSVTKTHDRIAQLGWQRDYHQPVPIYDTRYVFPETAKDPMKQVMREYLPMQLEKDERVYGGFDAALRASMPTKADERWLEVMKPLILILVYAEGAAGRCMSVLMDVVPNEELLNGYHVQFVDEVRHIGMQMNLARWYSKNTPDPAGWHNGQEYMANNLITRAGVNMFSHSFTGDPIAAGFTMMTVIETAFTNVAFVALPDVGTRNGDFIQATTYSSVQSDEARHISNGYATMLTMLQKDENVPLIERDLQQAWWTVHSWVDPFVGSIMEYFSTDRSDTENYLTKWDRWIRDDWYRSYVEQLGKMGVNVPPAMFDRARERLVNGLHHKTAPLAFAMWPLNFWKFDPLTEKDFDWFEKTTPGWYDEYGATWEAYAALADPKEEALLLSGLLEGAPPMCWSCMLACVIDEDMCHRVCKDGHGEERTRFYCSPECRWIDESNPGRYTGDRNYFDRHHGKLLSELIIESKLIRSDGKTLVGQPHLRTDQMWTIDDIRKCDFQVTSPNITTAEAMGLPCGSWHDPNDPHGAVMQDGNGFKAVAVGRDDAVVNPLEAMAKAAVGSTPWVAL
jgi:propane monooxygenase large subunit